MRRIWALMFAVVLGAAACSTSGDVAVQTVDQAADATADATADGAITPQSLQAAASRTAEVDSGRFSMTFAIEDFPFFGDLEFGMNGAFADGGDRVGMRMDLGEMFDQLPTDQMSPQERAIFEDSDLTIETRQIGDYMYMRSDLFAASGLVSGDKWIRVDMAEAAELSGLSPAELNQMSGSPFGAASTNAFLAFIEGTGAEIRDIGDKEIRGVETRGIATEINLRDVYALAAEEASEEIQGFLDQMDLGDALDITMPLEAYIDDAGLVRRMVMTFDMTELAEGAASEEFEGLEEFEEAMLGDMVMVISMDMYDFDTEVQIDEPVDFIDLTSEFLSGGF